MAQFQFNSKYEYLEHKLPENRCQQIYRCKPDAKTVCPDCWYNNIRVPFDTLVTLECSKCKEDQRLFSDFVRNINSKEKKKTVALTFKNETTVEMVSGCTDSCLWWVWFDQQRRNTLNDRDLKLVYKKR